MKIVNIAGYKFVQLLELGTLQKLLREICQSEGLKGTILLSHEGVNVTLAGMETAVANFTSFLAADSRFSDIRFHETYSTSLPFRHLKVKIKKEIITLRQSDLPMLERRAVCISPQDLKKWLDERHDITLLDTRNNYEIQFGSFNGALNLQINHFGELPLVLKDIDPVKPVVMFCTGGIRCEKAALYMEKKGFQEVYQLDGGILGYFAQVGNAHYSGTCFVFDERVTIGPESFS